jgi:EAL domain-containing protein (putative c-di-GMP-specific phosphodiesterase class I)
MSDKPFRLAVTDIDRAFEQGEFRLVFQPKIDLAQGRMTGAEAFIRWQHPTFGLLPPGLFLDFIEAAGRIADLTGFVFNESFRAAALWKARGRDWSISINVAPGTVTAPDFRQGLAELLDAYGLNPARVIIEIPERAVAQEPDALCHALNDIRTLGVHVALDGGGIVPVDLDAFNPMPFTAIKVGGPASIRLAQRLGLKGRGALAARLRQARRFGLEVVAVGAEDEATMEGLVGVGFTSAQGIWIQKPLTNEELLAWDGKWARGAVTIDVWTGSLRDVPRKAAPEAPAPQANLQNLAALTKADAQEAIAKVKARRPVTHQPTLQVKQRDDTSPPLPVLEADGLVDVVEDEDDHELDASRGRRPAFGAAPDANLTMKGLVVRRPARNIA